MNTTVRPRENWEWRRHPDHPDLFELYDGDRLLAWITKRPPYCDRGHWQMGVECVADIDSADGIPRYYMSFERAMAETADFLAWRLFKQTTRGNHEHRSAL